MKCPNCGDALSEVEEIDDDIEATGYIEVCYSLIFWSTHHNFFL